MGKRHGFNLIIKTDLIRPIIYPSVSREILFHGTALWTVNLDSSINQSIFIEILFVHTSLVIFHFNTHTVEIILKQWKIQNFSYVKRRVAYSTTSVLEIVGGKIWK